MRGAIFLTRPASTRTTHATHTIEREHPNGACAGEFVLEKLWLPSLDAATDAKGEQATPATAAVVAPAICFKKSFLCTPPPVEEAAGLTDMVKASARGAPKRRTAIRER